MHSIKLKMPLSQTNNFCSDCKTFKEFLDLDKKKTILQYFITSQLQPYKRRQRDCITISDILSLVHIKNY